jgi:ADP-glucose pyrophosphorylase
LGILFTRVIYVVLICILQKKDKIDEDSCVINSMLSGDVEIGKKSVVCGCQISGRVVVQSDSLISGLKIEVHEVNVYFIMTQFTPVFN